MSEHHPFRAASYLLSVHNPHQLPADDGLEVAISGRSNAGKSSAINKICSQTGLARTSKTPGRTQQLVYFLLAPQRFLVDLPGYGYAKVPPELRDHWRGLIEGYFQSRRALAGRSLAAADARSGRDAPAGVRRQSVNEAVGFSSRPFVAPAARGRLRAIEV